MNEKRTRELRHDHHFIPDRSQNEKNTRRVVTLTLLMMVFEIMGGLFYGSMALLADGIHMGTHAAALGITVFAYSYARRHSDDPKFSFGTGKVSILAGYSSSLGLAATALLMFFHSVERLIVPETIHFNQALAITMTGLVVNIVSALWLGNGHDHHKESKHADHNLRAAYLHVIADAVTSVFAIVALSAGKYLGWIWLDPAMGIVGGAIIAKWSWGLIQDTGGILLDRESKANEARMIRQRLTSGDTEVTDLHVWNMGEGHLAVIVSLVSRSPASPEHYKSVLGDIRNISHLTIEVNEV